jgi:predicted cytidylate kinase
MAITSSKFRIVTVSGKVATGTSTLSKNLTHALDWKYVNVGEIQREYDRDHQIAENKQGADSRPDDHEKEIDDMTKKMLQNEKDIIYEAWLSGFMAQGIGGVLKVLVICPHDEVRIDRVVNRENISIAEAKLWIKQREEENLKKWQKLYGPYDFWDPKYYDLVIDTYSSGPMETVGKVLDKLGYKGKLHK